MIGLRRIHPVSNLLLVGAFLMASGPGWGKGEQVSLKLRDGTLVRVLHKETRETGVTGQVGAFVLHFNRYQIETIAVPAAKQTLEESASILQGLDGANYAELKIFHGRIETLIRRLRDLDSRLKWLVPRILEPIPDLESAQNRIRGVLNRSAQAETLIGELNALAESTVDVQESWNRTVLRVGSTIDKIPFAERREELRKQEAEIVRKRELNLERTREPFFRAFRDLDLDGLTRADLEGFQDLAAEIENPILQSESVAILDRIRMRTPPGDVSERAEEDVLAQADKEGDDVKTIAQSSSNETAFSLAFIERLDPKLAIFAGAALFLIFGAPTLLKRVALRAKRRRNIQVVHAPVVEVGGPELASKPDSQPEPSREICEIMDPAMENLPEPDIPKLEPSLSPEELAPSPLETCGADEIEPEDSPEIEEEPEFFDANFDLELMTDEEDTSIEKPIVDLESVLEDFPSAAEFSEETGIPSPEWDEEKGLPELPQSSDRKMMEELFDALEQTIEEKLKGSEENKSSPEDSEVEASPFDDLAEPEVSLDCVFGFEPDISQFLEETPVEDKENRDSVVDEPDPEVSTSREEPSTSDSAVEAETNEEPAENGSFEIQVGSGYESQESEPSDLWENSVENPPEPSTTEECETPPIEGMNGRQSPAADMPENSARENLEEEKSEETQKGADPGRDEEEIICPVTGLFSRSFFDQQFPKTFQRCRRDRYPLTLVLLRIDHYADLPVSEDDDLRDDLLCTVANSLRKSVRTRDILARYDDSTFAVLMLQVKPTSAFPLALKIRNDLKKLNELATEIESVDLTVSFGMNCVLEDDRSTTRDELLEGCLESLERATNEGGNQIVLHGVEGESRL